MRLFDTHALFHAELNALAVYDEIKATESTNLGTYTQTTRYLEKAVFFKSSTECLVLQIKRKTLDYKSRFFAFTRRHVDACIVALKTF